MSPIEKQTMQCTVKLILGQSHPVIFSSFVVHTLCVFFKGSRFYFTLFHLHSSPVSIETIPCVPKYSMSLLLKPFETTTEYTVSCFVLCVVSFHFMVLYTIELFENLVVLHFLPPPLDSPSLLFLPFSIFPSFLLRQRSHFYNLFTVGGLMSSKLPPAVSCVV